MSRIEAGETVAYSVTWLEMDRAPTWPHPPAPGGKPVHLLRAHEPPAWYFLALYEAVGRDYAWEDLHRADRAELTAWLHDPEVAIFTLIREGWPAGFFALDWRIDGLCELALFGLVPEVLGTGLGTYLLRTAILAGWDHADVRRMAVNTCTLDHPRALGLYQRNGFSPVRREEKTRVLTRSIPRPQG